MKPIYDLLGVTVGIIQSGMNDIDKQEAYSRDVVYGTNSEFGFDYLRDNLADAIEQQGPARPRLRDRRRGRQHPHRRGAHAADHLRPARAGRRPLLQVREAGPDDGAGQEARGPRGQVEGLGGRLRLRARREAQDGRGDREGRREGREVPRHRQPLPRRERPPRQPPAAGAQGRVALQARRRLRRDRRRGQDHRRVHRPHPRGPPLVRGPAPGRRGQGGRGDPGGEPDRRHDHLPELLPQVRQARGHDRHGPHRGHRVHEDLRAPGRRDPHQPADGPARTTTTRSTRPRTASGRRSRARSRTRTRDRPAGAGRHDLGRGLRAAVEPS